MKNSITFLIPVIATLGVVITILMDNYSAGLLITLFYTPLLIIYALITIKPVLKKVETKLKPLFFSVATINTIVVLIYVLFKTMHWPYTGPLKVLGTFICVLTLGITLVYFLINRKQISTGLTLEMILVLLPAIVFIWSIIPYNVPPQLYDDYVELISESNYNLEITNKNLVADSCQIENLTKISELKSEIIKWSGGYEGNRIRGFYDQYPDIYIDREKDLIKSLDIKPELKKMILNVRITGDAIFLLTQIESALLIKKCP